MSVGDLLQWVALIPVVCGSVFALLCVPAVRRFFRLSHSKGEGFGRHWPAVTVLKPVCGLEKNLRVNLRSICLQDYPEYQVVFCVQRAEDPAVPIVRSLEQEFGLERVTVVIRDLRLGMNGKVNNLAAGLAEARHDLLVLSDSDCQLRPDYMRAVVAPLAEPDVGCVCTVFRAARADRWYEKLELLTINADFMPSVIFAYMTGSSRLCLGPSVALRRSTLKEMGGFESLAEYFVEDYEIGRRVWNLGKRMVLLPYVIDCVVDLRNLSHWWRHQLYWDQNTRAARPWAFFATILTRSVPFALLFAVLRLGDPVGLGVLMAAVAVRLGTAAVILAGGLQDREGLRSLWLLPLRDVLGVALWAAAFMERTVVWRDKAYRLTRDGRLEPRSDDPRCSCEGTGRLA